MDPLIVYFSSKTGNTSRFVESLGVRSVRIPFSVREECPEVDEPYVLVCPTYAHDDGSNAVPKQVIRFLNNPRNRALLQGVIGGGNRNFGEWFAHGANVVSRKCGVPVLYRFELSGTSIDRLNVRKGLRKLWNSLIPETTQAKIPA